MEEETAGEESIPAVRICLSEFCRGVGREIPQTETICLSCGIKWVTIEEEEEAGLRKARVRASAERRIEAEVALFKTQRLENLETHDVSGEIPRRVAGFEAARGWETAEAGCGECDAE